jgi:hypothetical protein
MITAPQAKKRLAKMRLQLLKEIIEDHCGGVIAEFARRIERRPSYVWALLNNRRPLGESLSRHIEHKLQLMSGTLQFPEALRTADDELNVFTYSRGTTGEKRVHHLAPMMQWNDLKTKKGSGGEIVAEFPVGATELRRCPVECSARTIVLPVDDDSMMPTLRPGAETFNDLLQRKPKAGRVLLMHHPDWARPRHMSCTLVAGVFHLSVENERYAATMPVQKLSVQHAVLGTVVYVGRSLIVD